MTSPGPGAALLDGGRCRFRVWAPFVRSVEVRFLAPRERALPLVRRAGGWHEAVVEGVEAGSLYLYRLDGGRERPDPASRAQPHGVLGPSRVVGRGFPWEDDAWRGVLLEDHVIYELHVGTFTPEGTLDAVAGRLDALADLGVTAVELMPLAPFPGARNWGYDGVAPFAVHEAYGGPEALKRLVAACHARGLAVVLDVVYNHLGPEGNVLAEFGPYFTDRYQTPWGPAVNFDGPGSDEVRAYFIASALQWVNEFHVDGLRLDAVHAIFDRAPVTFLEELGAAVHGAGRRRGRHVHLFAESAGNDPRLVRPPELGGWGLDATWNDDFHHALHALLTGERDGYYADYGDVAALVEAFRRGFVYTGQYSRYRGRRHGAPCGDVPAPRFVVFAQNHDQVGNRARGDRLSTVVSFEAVKLAAALVLLSPFVPLLFMGEEYGEIAPFPYFVSHTDPDLVTAVRRGRREEFRAFGWTGEIPDPQAEATFRAAALDHRLRERGRHGLLVAYHTALLRERRERPALAHLDTGSLEAWGNSHAGTLVVRRWHAGDEAVLVAHFGPEETVASVPLPAGRWRAVLDSAAGRWGGPGRAAFVEIVSDGEARLPLPPSSALLLRREGG